MIGAVLRKKSVTGAADTLGISQSMVSHTLTRARKLLDDPIVVPDKGQMEPTKTGYRLALKIESILMAGNVIHDVKAEPGHDVSNTVRIFCTDDISLIFGPRIISALRKANFTGAISFNRPSQGTLRRYLSDPLCALFSPTALLQDAMMQKTVSMESWALVCRTDHAALSQNALEYKHLFDYHFIVVRPFDGIMNPLDMVMQLKGDRRNISAFVRTYHEMIPMLLESDSISIIPVSVARHLEKIYPVSIRLITAIPDLPSFSISMAWAPEFSAHQTSLRMRTAILSALEMDASD